MGIRVHPTHTHLQRAAGGFSEVVAVFVDVGPLFAVREIFLVDEAPVHVVCARCHNEFFVKLIYLSVADKADAHEILRREATETGEIPEQAVVGEGARGVYQFAIVLCLWLALDWRHSVTCAPVLAHLADATKLAVNEYSQ